MMRSRQVIRSRIGWGLLGPISRRATSSAFVWPTAGQWPPGGIQLSYAEQPQTAGLAQIFLIGCPCVGGDAVALVLGDNIFYGQGLSHILPQVTRQSEGATMLSS